MLWCRLIQNQLKLVLEHWLFLREVRSNRNINLKVTECAYRFEGALLKSNEYKEYEVING